MDDHNNIIFNIGAAEIYSEELIKITYQSVTAWVKIVYPTNQQFPNYDHILSPAKTQFNILHEDVLLLDACDVIIPREFFNIFIKTYNRECGFILQVTNSAPDILDLDKPVVPPSPSSVSTASTISSECSSNFADINDDDCRIQFPQRTKLIESLLKKDLEQYIQNQRNIDINGQILLENYKKYNFLTSKDRIKVINIIADHINLNNSKITREDKILWAKVAIQIFPCLHDETTEGKYEIVYDPKTRGGFLGNRLKTLSKISTKRHRIFTTSDKTTADHTVDDFEFDHLEDDINFLKSASTASEIKEIKQKLTATYNHRQKLIINRESEKIVEVYPILLKSIELIHFEFELGRPNKSDKFSQFWDETTEHRIISAAHQTKNFAIDSLEFCTSVKALYCLLLLCPPAVKGRGSKTKCGVAAAFQKLLILHEHNTSLEKSVYISVQPYIIASGINFKHIDRYHVVVDGTILDAGTNLKNAIDVCFKTYYIFNIKYDENLRIFWGFLQHFVYEIDLENVSTCMRHCHALLNSSIT